MQAQLALSQAQDATRKNTQDLKNARLALSRWTGMPAATVSDETPKLTSHVPGLPIEELEKYHPMLLTARRAIILADADRPEERRVGKEWLGTGVSRWSPYNKKKNNIRNMTKAR